MRPLASFTQSGKRSFIYVIYHVAFLFVPEKLALVTTFPDGRYPLSKAKEEPGGKEQGLQDGSEGEESAKDRNAKAPITHCPGCKKSCPLVKAEMRQRRKARRKAREFADAPRRRNAKSPAEAISAHLRHQAVGFRAMRISSSVVTTHILMGLSSMEMMRFTPMAPRPGFDPDRESCPCGRDR